MAYIVTKNFGIDTTNTFSESMDTLFNLELQSNEHFIILS